MNYKPDFLIKPYEVHACKGLRPSDSDVYAVVYWFERMRGEKCTASNSTIAEVACLKERTIGAALERLEKHGFIQRVYEDKERTKRLEIKTCVHMTKGTFQTEPKKKKAQKQEPTEDTSKVPAVVDESKNEPTPGELARDFFAPKGSEVKYRDQIIEEIVQATGAPKDALMAEVRKFYIYWTEPTKSGKKQLWETKPTFEVKRRLYTWLSRAGKYNGTGPKKGSGSGATI